MSTIKSALWAIFFVAVSSVAIGAEGDNNAAVKSDGPIMLDMDGNAKNLKDYIGNGKWLVVKVWASNCHVCNESIYEMKALYDERHNKDVDVLGIAIDGYENKAAVAGFINRHKVNFPNLIDDGTVFASVYYGTVGTPWIGATPTYLLFAPDGEIIAENIGAVSKKVVEDFIAKNDCQRDSKLC